MFQLIDEQRQLQDMVRRVARERVAPRAAAIDKTAEYPQDMFELLKDLGLFALPFPVEIGGGGSLLSACVVLEEFARVCYNTAYLLVVQWVPFGAIQAGGTPAQKDRWLPRLADGSARGALSLTEPQSGSDVAGIKTTARRQGAVYVLDGAKIWCTNSPVADFILVAARTLDADGASQGINLFLAERGTPGLTIGEPEDKLGGRGVPSCPLFFDQLELPAEAMLGLPGANGFKLVMETLNASRPIVAARGVGLAQGAIDHSIEFITQRTAFGQKVSDFQGIRWMLADMIMKTEAARQLTYNAAAQADAGLTGRALAPFSSMAKCFASDAAMQVATDAVQLFGAAGISSDYPIHRYFRDAKLLQIVEGTNQIQRNLIADLALGTSRTKAAK